MLYFLLNIFVQKAQKMGKSRKLTIPIQYIILLEVG